MDLVFVSSRCRIVTDKATCVLFGRFDDHNWGIHNCVQRSRSRFQDQSTRKETYTCSNSTYHVMGSAKKATFFQHKASDPQHPPVILYEPDYDSERTYFCALGNQLS